MIQKVYEIGCDWCGNADYAHTASYKAAEQYYQNTGGVVIPNRRHFCNNNCYEQYLDERRKK